MNKKLIAGNWKMNLLPEAALKLISEIQPSSKCDVLVAPIYPVIPIISQSVEGKGIYLAAQNCHEMDKGAFTGEVPAIMLKAIGCSHVIIGHSERRSFYNETDTVILKKVDAALRNNLIPIICVGETLDQRDRGEAREVLDIQLIQLLGEIGAKYKEKEIIIAYEPVWAIGTGRIPTPDQIKDAHSHIRKICNDTIGEENNRTRILYGGSLNPSNADMILAIDDVDGGLIGGASLDAEKFNKIIEIAASLS